MKQPLGQREAATASWAERAAERSPTVQRSRDRSMQRAKQIVQAARRLAAVKGSSFTTQELVKEAGVAVQTFYKHFQGKDQVLLAVIDDLITEACADLERRGGGLPDPVSRLRFYIKSVISGIGAGGEGGARPRFITVEHWRLHTLYPEELAHATRRFTDLVLPEIRAGADAGLLRPANPDYDAWLVTQLIMAVFHYYEYAPADEPVEEIAERLWTFCYAALGGAVAAGGAQ